MSYLNTHKYLFASSVIAAIAIAFCYVQYHYAGQKYRIRVNAPAGMLAAQITRQHTAAHFYALRFKKLIPLAAASSPFLKRYGDNSLVRANQLARFYNQRFKLTTAPKADTVQAEVTDDNPERAKLFLTCLINSYRLRYASTDNGATAGVMQDSLHQLNRRIATLKTVKLHGEITVPVNAKKKVAISLKDRTRLISEYKVILNYVNQANTAFVIIPDAFLPDDSLLKRLIGEHNQQQLTRQRLLSGDLAGSASLSIINHRIASLKTTLKEYSRTQLAGLNAATYSEPIQNHNKSLLSTVQDSEAVKSQLSALFTKANGLKHRLLSLTASPPAAVYRTNKLRFTIITVTRPAVTLCYIAALFAGLLLPLPIIYRKKNITKSITNAEGINRLTSIPLIGEVDDWNTHAKQLADDEVLSNITGRLRIKTPNPPTIILVTAIKSSGDEISCCRLLADELVKRRYKVAILNYFFSADYSTLQASFSAGELYKYLAYSGKSPEELLVQAIKPGVCIINNGHDHADTIDNNTEQANLLYTTAANERLNQLMRHIKKTADYILIAVPNVTIHPNREFLAQLTDATIVLVKYHDTLDQEIIKLEKLKNEESLSNPLLIASNAAQANNG